MAGNISKNKNHSVNDMTAEVIEDKVKKILNVYHMDSEPVEGSDNPVSSDGVFKGFAEIGNRIDELSEEVKSVSTVTVTVTDEAGYGEVTETDTVANILQKVYSDTRNHSILFRNDLYPLIDSLVQTKADKADTYTKAELDSRIGAVETEKANNIVTVREAESEGTVEKTDTVANILDNLSYLVSANEMQMSNDVLPELRLLNDNKADKSDTYTKSEIDTIDGNTNARLDTTWDMAYYNSEKITELEDYVYNIMLLSVDNLWEYKADKTTIETSESTAHTFEFSNTHNTEKRLGEVTSISFTFGNGEYNADYTSGLSFDSGATPTAVDYTDSGILNWVGTDCATSGGLSIFQPSANTHYDIVFYYNGMQFIGLVNGFVPASGNVVSV